MKLIMKATVRIWIILLGALIMPLAFQGCKAVKKAVSYEDVYKEQPVTVYVAPFKDNTALELVRTSREKAYNDELRAAALYMRQTIAEPLLTQGYYVLTPLASEVIAMQDSAASYKDLMNGDIKRYSTLYGVDAILLVQLHKWAKPEVNELVVYVEYTLRSTKTGVELMHTWVKGTKMQPVGVKGEPMLLASDRTFMQTMGMDEESEELAMRCILLEQMSDFVLRNLPTSRELRQYKRDQYTPAFPAYYGFVYDINGEIEQTQLTEDSFGNDCFTY